MSGVRGPVVLCVLAAVAAPAVFAQTVPLNPTVRVLEKPQSIIPTDCDQGLAPAAPRPVVVAAAEPVAPRDVPAPPASDLRTRLRRVQTAADNGDYASFKFALDEARNAVSTYPGGGEKQSASDVLQVYGDLERLWDYSMSSATGSFFDASSADGTIIAALRRYPGFPRAVADATMNIGGQSVYPSRETRQFLAEEAAKRLRSLGVRTPSRVVLETPVPRTGMSTQTRSVPRTTTTTKKSSATPRTTARTTPKAASSPAAKQAPARAGASQKQPRTQAPRLVEKPPIAKPAPPPVKVARAEPAPLQPQPQSQPPSEPQPPQPVTETTAATATAATESTDTITSSAAPVETQTTATEAPKPAPASAPARGVNLPFAIILIVIGIAVLVLLFRSSD